MHVSYMPMSLLTMQPQASRWPLVLQVPALGDRNHGDHGISEERVRPCGRRLRQLARVKEVHERLVLAEHSFHELAVDASVVRNAPGREVGLPRHRTKSQCPSLPNASVLGSWRGPRRSRASAPRRVRPTARSRECRDPCRARGSPGPFDRRPRRRSSRRASS